MLENANVWCVLEDVRPIYTYKSAARQLNDSHITLCLAFSCSRLLHALNVFLHFVCRVGACFGGRALAYGIWMSGIRKVCLCVDVTITQTNYVLPLCVCVCVGEFDWERGFSAHCGRVRKFTRSILRYGVGEERDGGAGESSENWQIARVIITHEKVSTAPLAAVCVCVACATLTLSPSLLFVYSPAVRG